jgi:Fe-coproporphyrin III synthase
MRLEAIKDFCRAQINLIPHKAGLIKAFPPATLYLAINSSCNLRCRMCDFGQQNKKSTFYKNLSAGNRELSLSDVKKLARQLKGFKTKIAITSTEPLLHKEIIPMIGAVREAGLACQLTTNGILLKRYAKQIVASGLDELWVSVDGPPAVHDRIRGVKGAFKRSIEGLLAVMQAKQDARKRKPSLNINCTMSELNLGSLHSLYKELHRLDLDQILFTHINFVTEEMAKEHNKTYKGRLAATETTLGAGQMSVRDCGRMHNDISFIKKEKDRRVSFVPDLPTHDDVIKFYKKPSSIVGRGRCLAPWVSAQILANGEVTIMTRCFGVRVGSIHEKGFMQIWNGKEMQSFRRLIREKKALPACTRCCGMF